MLLVRADRSREDPLLRGFDVGGEVLIGDSPMSVVEGSASV